MVFEIRESKLEAAINAIQDLLHDSRIENHLKLLQRGGEPQNFKIVEEHKRIPQGNYYLDNYDIKGELIDVIDLHINGKFQLSLKGLYPLFMVRSFINNHRKTNKTILTHTIESAIAITTIDRLKQIIDRRGNGIAKGFLIREDIKEVLKYVIQEKSFTPNNFKKNANKVVYISLKKNADGTLVNGGSWQYNSENNPHGVFADAFKDNVDLEEFTAFTNEHNIVLGENSEQSQMKGTWVMFTPELDKAKIVLDNFRLAPVVNDDGYCYRSQCLSVDPDTGHMSNIYGNSQKVYARVKSLIAADSAPYVRNDKDKLDINGNPIFNRSKSYLHWDLDKINKYDELRKATTFNVLVVFKEGSREILNHLNPEGKDVDDYTHKEIEYYTQCFEDSLTGECRNEFSQDAHTADCHFTIAKEVADQIVTLQRTIEIECNTDNLTKEFIDRIKEFKATGEAVVFTQHQLGEPIGYSHKCPKCDHLMSGAQAKEDTYIMADYVDSKQQIWKCKSCDYILTNSTAVETIKLNSKFKPASQIKIINIGESIEGEGLSLQCEIDVPTNIARIVSDDGLKGMSCPTSDNYQGTISGTTHHPETGEEISMDKMKVDAIIPFGAFKGKESGMSLALARFMNAYFNTEINPEYYKNAGAMDLFEDMLTNWWKSSDIVWERDEIVSIGKERRLRTVKTSTKDGLRFGVIEIRVTESNIEFTKMDTELYPMKVSPMNDLFYRTLGFNKLADALKKHSFGSLENLEHRQLVEHLLRVQMFNPGEGYTVIEPTELARAFEIPFTNVMSYSKWKKVLENHDFFNNDKMINGFSIPINIDGLQVQVTFPPREVMTKLVAVNKFSNRIRLNSSLRKMFEVYSMLTRDISRVRKNNLNNLSNEISKEFDGKRGLLAQTSTYMYPGIKSKKISDGDIPTGVAVADMPGQWQYIHRNLYNGEFKDLDYQEFIRRISLPTDNEDSIQVFMTLQRDPFIWYGQALNAIELWHPHKANRYFKHKIKTSFFDKYPQFKPNGVGGILTNVLDGLFFFQDDSDGDLARGLLALNKEVQNMLRALNSKMRNYGLLFSGESYGAETVYQCNKWWHIKYVIEEITGNTSIAFKAKDSYRLDISTISVEDRNKAIIAATNAKESVGPTTISQWTVQDIAGYMYRIGMGPYRGAVQPITYEQMIDVCSLYQKALTQDGTIRSIKHVSGELNKLTLDALALNTMTVQSSSNDGEKISPRNKMHELAQVYLSKHDAGKTMEHIAEFWQNNAKVDGNKISTKKATITAKILRAFSKLTHGGKSGFGKNDNFMQYLIHDNAKYLFSYETHKSLIKLIKSIYNPVYEKLTKRGK